MCAEHLLFGDGIFDCRFFADCLRIETLIADSFAHFVRMEFLFADSWQIFCRLVADCSGRAWVGASGVSGTPKRPDHCNLQTICKKNMMSTPEPHPQKICKSSAKINILQHRVFPKQIVISLISGGSDQHRKPQQARCERSPRRGAVSSWFEEFF